MKLFFSVIAGLSLFCSLALADANACLGNVITYDIFATWLKPAESQVDLKTINQNVEAYIRDCNIVSGCATWSKADNDESYLVERHSSSAITLSQFSQKLEFQIAVESYKEKQMVIATTYPYYFKYGIVSSTEDLVLSLGDRFLRLKTPSAGSMDVDNYQMGMLAGYISDSCYRFSQSYKEKPAKNGSYREMSILVSGQIIRN